MSLSSSLVFRSIPFLIAALAIAPLTGLAGTSDTVWFDKPGNRYGEATVQGNGRLGAMDLGGVDKDRIVLNESSIWSGGPYEANRPDAYKCLPEVRAKFFAGDYEGAGKLLTKNFGYAEGVPGWMERDQFGTYQTLGDLTLNIHGKDTPVTGYRRELDLVTGLARTEFVRDGVKFTREIVVSKPDEVIAVRLRADKPFSFDAALSRKQIKAPEGVAAPFRAEGDLQVMEGRMPFKPPGKPLTGGIKYLTLLSAQIPSGKPGTVTTTDKGVEIHEVTEVVLLVSATADLRNPGYAEQARARLKAAQGRTFDAIRDDAAKLHASFMNRFAVKLPDGPNSALPTPERVKKVNEKPDPALAALFTQFGRHLMVAGSQPDSTLPTNLQGIWGDEYDMPWRGDFHSNINLQMNYWPAESTGLSDCHLPLMRFIGEVAKEGAKTAKAYYDAPGWMANHTQNPWYETAPSFLPACVGPVCGAWLAQHLWTHYDFTRDEKFLRENYPLLRGAAEFMLAVLVEDPKTKTLVICPSNSPENVYRFKRPDGTKGETAFCVGSSFDTQITRDLFINTAAAARILGVDTEFAEKLDVARARMEPTRLGDDGRIMEWREAFEETDPHHRHTSHLWALYPGTEISPATPELFAGARKTLERRGDQSTGWSMAWKANFWARLRDGDHAEILLKHLIHKCDPNLFDQHPPFQIDGNFGGAAAVAEMLLQSHEVTKDGAVVIDLLPALPKTWADGSVSGIRARGDFTLDIVWKAGAVTKVVVRSGHGAKAVLRANGVTIPLTLAAGASVTLEGKTLPSGVTAAAKHSLNPGDTVDLADLTATEWLKGEAPKSFEPGKIYVFECWATWCGACVAIMPHLEEMHKKFHDKGVYFHGMDVWEDDKALGEKFVREKGGVMPYPVAYVGKNSPFEKKWLKAAGVTGIPHAFVVKDGKLLVACGPGRLTEETLTAMLSPESCDKVVADIIRKEEIQERAFAAFLAFRAAEKKGDFAAMEKALADGERYAPGHPTVNQIKRLLAAARAKAETAEPVAKAPAKPLAKP